MTHHPMETEHHPSCLPHSDHRSHTLPALFWIHYRHRPIQETWCHHGMHVAFCNCLHNTKLLLLFFMFLPLAICSTFVHSAPSVIPLSLQFVTFCVQGGKKRQRLKMSSQLGLCSSTDLTGLLLKMSSSSESEFLGQQSPGIPRRWFRSKVEEDASVSFYPVSNHESVVVPAFHLHGTW